MRLGYELSRFKWVGNILKTCQYSTLVIWKNINKNNNHLQEKCSVFQMPESFFYDESSWTNKLHRFSLETQFQIENHSIKQTKGKYLLKTALKRKKNVALSYKNTNSFSNFLKLPKYFSGTEDEHFGLRFPNRHWTSVALQFFWSQWIERATFSRRI